MGSVVVLRYIRDESVVIGWCYGIMICRLGYPGLCIWYINEHSSSEHTILSLAPLVILFLDIRKGSVSIFIHIITAQASPSRPDTIHYQQPAIPHYQHKDDTKTHL